MAEARPNPIRDLQDEITCPVCLDDFKDPVSIECGHSFCRACISRTWRRIHSQFPCPQCRNISKWRFLRPNRLVENVVEITNRMLETTLNDSERMTCKMHQEPLKLYCVDDELEICLVCRESIFHKSHDVIPVEESTRDFKTNLQDKLKTLEKEVAYLTQRKSEEEEKSEILKSDVSLKRRIVAAEFESLRQLVTHNERILNDRLESLEKTISEKSNQNITRLNAKLDQLQKRIADIEKKSTPQSSPKPPDVSTVNRCFDDEHVIEQGPSNPFGTSIRDYLKMFTVPVMFDQKTANYNLVFTESHKCVRYEDYPSDLIPHSGRFDSKPCVLGLTGYKIGKRYWEVEVGDGIYWSVGVARQSVYRKGAFKIQPKSGIWAIGLLGMYMDRYYAFTNPDILLYPKQHPVRISVFLDCEEHCVAFYNADTMEHLHTFSCVQPNEKLYPFFCVGAMGTELRLD